MATTIPAIAALLTSANQTNNLKAWDMLPLGPPMKAATRATVITALLGGTIASEADALALIATAATVKLRVAALSRPP